jgi:hypothetical protein
MKTQEGRWLPRSSRGCGGATHEPAMCSLRRHAVAVSACALVLGATATPAAAQRLDPAFPTINSSVSGTAAAFLDLGSEDRDAAQLMVTRFSPLGISMVLTANDGLQVKRVGLRRMTGFGDAFAPNVDTLHAMPAGDEIVDGVSADGGILADNVCVLTSGFDNGSLLPRAGLKCFAENGALVASADTPIGFPNRTAGAVISHNFDMVVAGAYSTGNSPTSNYRLYFERRRLSDLGLIGVRVDHDITLSSPPPASNNQLQVTALEKDADGRFLVAGFMRRAEGADSEAFVARFNGDFSRDTGFGVDGVVNLGFSGTGPNHSFGIASDVTGLGNGTIVVTGVGCVSTQCGTAPGMMRSQQITRALRSNGSGGEQFESVPSTTFLPRPQLEVSGAPFLPGAAFGFVLVQPQLDRSVRLQTLTVNALGAFGFLSSDTFRLQYAGQPGVVVEQNFRQLQTIRYPGDFHHYVAWTFKANNGNANDFDMVMGQLMPTWRVFADSFE